MSEPMTSEDAYWALVDAISANEGSLTEAGAEKALAPLFAERDRLRERLTVTDAMVERAALAMHNERRRQFGSRPVDRIAAAHCLSMEWEVRAALEAALGKENGNG